MTNFLDLSRDQIRDLCFYIFPQAEDTGEPKFSNGAIVVPVYFDGGQVTVYIHEQEVVYRDRFNLQHFKTTESYEFLTLTGEQRTEHIKNEYSKRTAR